MQGMVVHQQVEKIALWANRARLIVLSEYNLARENKVA
jgi:hypothetical protein